MKASEFITEAWSQKYKSSINCSHPKGFSQRAHCAGKKKHNESIEMEMTCPDCGMCQTHGKLDELKKGQKDSNGYTRCWPGKHAEGTKTGKNGGQVRNCVPNESQELDEIDRRGFLKGLGAAAVAGAAGYKLGQGSGNAEKEMPNNPAAYYLMGYFYGGINHLQFQSPIIAQWSKEFGPYIDDANLKIKSKAINQKLIDAWDNGFYEGRQNQETRFNNNYNAAAESYAQYWKSSHDKLVSLLKKQNENVEQGVAEELSEEFDLIETIINQIADQNGVDAELVWEDLESLTEDELYAFAVTSQLNEDWQKVNKKDKTDGMSKKAVSAYRREHPGSKLKTAVTTKPSKLKKGSKASKRRKSYCSRSKGQMKMHNISCQKTPDKAICKARRRWNC